MIELLQGLPSSSVRKQVFMKVRRSQLRGEKKKTTTPKRIRGEGTLSAQVENCFFRAKSRQTRKRLVHSAVNVNCCQDGDRNPGLTSIFSSRIQQLPSVQRSYAGIGQSVSPLSQSPAQDTPFRGPSFMLPFGCFLCPSWQVLLLCLCLSFSTLLPLTWMGKLGGHLG